MQSHFKKVTPVTGNLIDVEMLMCVCVCVCACVYIIYNISKINKEVLLPCYLALFTRVERFTAWCYQPVTLLPWN